MQIYSSITSFQQDNNGSIFKQDVSSENNKVRKKYGIYNMLILLSIRMAYSVSTMI